MGMGAPFVSARVLGSVELLPPPGAGPSGSVWQGPRACLQSPGRERAAVHGRTGEATEEVVAGLRMTTSTRPVVSWSSRSRPGAWRHALVVETAEVHALPAGRVRPRGAVQRRGVHVHLVERDDARPPVAGPQPDPVRASQAARHDLES